MRPSPQLTALFAVLAAEATAPEHPAHDYFVQRTAAVFERLHAAFVEASDAGELVAGTEPASAAYRLMALMDGLQVLWLYSPSVDMAAEVRTFLAGVLRSPL